MDIVERVIRGDYGMNEYIKRLDGYNYALVQNEVNRRLGYSKRHDPFDYYEKKIF